MPRTMQFSFSQGEISPSLHGRVDLEQYGRGVALAENCFVKVFGGLANRPGTRFIDYTPSDRVTRLITFAFSDDQQYALEFSEFSLRFFALGGQLQVPPTPGTLARGVGPGLWFDASSGGASVQDPGPGNANNLLLVGAPGGVAAAEQLVAGVPAGVEHCIALGCNGAIVFQVETSFGLGDILAPRRLDPGTHLVAFTQPGNSFLVRLSHDGNDARLVGNLALLNSGGSQAPAPIGLGTPFTEGQISTINVSQKADVLNLVHPQQPPYELRRYGTLSWSLVLKRFGSSVDPPQGGDLSIQATGTPATTYYYAVTYQSDIGEESPRALISVEGAASLNDTDHVEITVAQPLPIGVVRALVYKFRGGVYGFMTAVPAGQPNFIDNGTIAPKTDQTPPQERNPFSAPGDYPSAVGYFEQRLVFAGTDNAPDSVECSRPAAFDNFARSNPSRDDDAITFTPAGNLVRRIRHALGAKVLYLFTDSAVLAARRGPNGFTPALEGGVGVEVAKGASFVPPLIAGGSTMFVSTQGKSVHALVYDQGSDSYAGNEVSLLSEHLLRHSPVVDWGWCEAPFNILWMVRLDGRLLSLSYLDREQVTGWAQHVTAGTFEACCAVREQGEDHLYVQTRRRIGGAFRRCVERLESRVFEDIRDAFFVDCGLSYDEPWTIAAVIPGPGNLAMAVIGHPFAVGDLMDVDGTGVSQIDGKRFRIGFVDGDAFTLTNPFTGADIPSDTFDPWLGGGVVRKALAVISGLGHLEGESVAVLADGASVGPLTVSGGQFTLARPASRVHAGLPYTMRIKTLAIPEVPEAFGRRKRVVGVQAFVATTRGLEAGSDFERMSEKRPRRDEAWGEPTRPMDGMVEISVPTRWGLGGQVCFREAGPLPAEVQAVLPVFERSDG